MNKKVQFLALLVMVPFLFFYCSKKGGTTTGQEENLIIAIDPDPGSAVAKALGASYEVKLTIQSKMPPQGVDVTVVYKKDSDNSIIFSQALQTSSSPLTLTINNVPFNDVGTVTIEVKSKSKPANTASKTFKLVRK